MIPDSESEPIRQSVGSVCDDGYPDSVATLPDSRCLRARRLVTVADHTLPMTFRLKGERVESREGRVLPAKSVRRLAQTPANLRDEWHRLAGPGENHSGRRRARRRHLATAGDAPGIGLIAKLNGRSSLGTRPTTPARRSVWLCMKWRPPREAVGSGRWWRQHSQ